MKKNNGWPSPISKDLLERQIQYLKKLPQKAIKYWSKILSNQKRN